MPDAGSTFATATWIDTNSSTQSLVDSLNSSNTEDYYQFKLSYRSSLNLALNELSADANVQLLNSNSGSIQETTGHTASEFINTTLDAGLYYIRVSLAEPDVATNYRLELQTQNGFHPNLIWRNGATGENFIWQMDGATPVGTTPLIEVTDLNWRIAATGNFTQDNQADIVWWNQATGAAMVWQMDGTIPITTINLPDFANDLNWRIETAGDFTGDGQTDLIWRNTATGHNTLWEMDGTSLYASISLPTVEDLTWQIAGAGDFTGDGQIDLLWRNDTTGNNRVWQMDGATPIATIDLPALPDVNWQIAGVGDFNNNGQTDIVWRNGATGENLIWLMQGTAPVATVNLVTVSDPNWHMMATLAVSQEPSPIDTVGNTPATAWNMGTLSSQQTYQEFVGGTDVSDYYQFTLTRKQWVNLHLTNLIQDANLQLSDANGAVIQSSTNADNWDEAINLELDAGTYQLEVSAEAETSYYLSLSGSGYGGDSTADPGGDLSSGSGYGGDSSSGSGYGSDSSSGSGYGGDSSSGSGYGNDSSSGSGSGSPSGSGSTPTPPIKLYNAEEAYAAWYPVGFNAGLADGASDRRYGYLFPYAWMTRHTQAGYLDGYDYGFVLGQSGDGGTAPPNSGGSGGGSNTPPSDAIDWHYTRKLNTIVLQTLQLLSGEEHTQLLEQLFELQTVGWLVSSGNLYNSMNGVVGNLFAVADQTNTLSGIKLAATNFKAFLEASPEPTAELVFPAKVLVAAKGIPNLQEQMNDPAFVNVLVELANAYAELTPSELATEDGLTGFSLHTLWLAEDLTALQEGGTQFAEEFAREEEFLRNANKLTVYKKEIEIKSLELGNEAILFVDNLIDDQFDFYPIPGIPLGFETADKGEIPTSIKVERGDRNKGANGDAEDFFTGDQRFIYYSKTRDSLTDEELTYLEGVGNAALFPGDSLYFPFANSVITLRPPDQVAVWERLLDAISLAPQSALALGIDTFETIKDNFALTVSVLGLLGAAQLTPIGPVINAGLVLLLGYQTGFSFASFLLKGAQAQTQDDLWAASQDFVKFVEAIVSLPGAVGLLNLSSTGSLAATTSKVSSAIQRFTKEVKLADLLAIRSVDDFADVVLAATFKVAAGENLAVDKLMQFGSSQVIDFLKRGFTKFKPDDLLDLSWLNDIGERINRISQIATKLDENADVATFLANNRNLVKSILDEGVEAVDDLANLLNRPGMTGQELKELLDIDEINPNILRQLFDDEGLTAAEIQEGFAVCFVAGTKVLTPTGERAIESLGVGEFVLASDPESGVIKPCSILQRFEREASAVLDIQVGNEIITCTPEHPFWIPGQGWQAANQLQVGDTLLTHDGKTRSIESIQCREGLFKVYNIEVEELHTYYVSSLQVLVHNECDLKVVKRSGMPESDAIDSSGNPVIIDGRPIKVYGQAFRSSSTTPGHGDAMMDLVARLAPTGDYEYFTLQRSWRTATGRVGSSGDIPDVIGVRRDGKVDAWEVQSATDDPVSLRQRLSKGMNSLPLERRGNTDVIPSKP
jgi:hypothetical protein